MNEKITDISSGGIDWENINLKRPFERSLNLITPLTFETLLLEVGCNIPEITKGAIIMQFKEDVSNRVEEAWEIFGANLDAIFDEAVKTRKD